MSEEPENLVLHYLRRVDAKVDRMAEDIRDLKTHRTSFEEAFIGVQRRFDRLELRVDQIERRLDLVDTPHGVNWQQMRLAPRIGG